MNSFLIKTYIELGYLVINKRIDTKSFANEFNLSNYELRKDIEAISNLGQNAGILIQIQDNTLYYDIVDENLYEKYKRNFPVLYYNSRYHDNNEDMFLSSFITKYIILRKDKYVTIDELADIMGFSKSKLRNPIKEARNLLEQYGFELRNVSHHGLILKNTDEYRIRLCLTMQYLTFDIRCFYNEEVDKSFNDFFSCYSEVLNILDKITENSKRSINKAERKKLAYFLMVQASRIFYNNELEIIDNIEMLLLNTIKNYQTISSIAIDIANKMSNLYHLKQYSHQEIDYICVLLVITMGFPDITNEIINELYIDEKEELYDLVFDFFKNDYGLKIDGIYRNSMEIAINNILIKKKINMLNVKGMAVNGRSANFYRSPLASKIIKDLKNTLDYYFHQNIPITQFADIIEILIMYLSSIKIEYIRPNIAITSRNSNFEPLLIENIITNEVDNDTYDKLDIIEYGNIYPENIKNLKNYDMIFCDQKLVYDDRLILYNEDVFELGYLKQIIKNNRDYYHKYLKDENVIIENYSYEALMKMISKIESDNDYIIINNILFLICKNDKNILHVGNVDNNGIKNYVLLELNISENNIAFFHTLLAKLAYNYDCLFELINGNKYIINEMIISSNK